MRCLVACLSMLSVCLVAVEAPALTIGTTDDAYVESFFPDLVQGGDLTLVSGNLSSVVPADLVRIYLTFALPAFTPGTSISSASLNGFLETSVDFGGLVYAVSLASSDAWDEGTITWNNQPGIGAATGAFFDPTGIPDGTSVNIPGLGAAADAAYQGDGFLSLVLVTSDESQLVCNADCPIASFTSDEGGNGFTLDFTVVPEPGTALLTSLGLLGLAIARRAAPPRNRDGFRDAS